MRGHRGAGKSIDADVTARMRGDVGRLSPRKHRQRPVFDLPCVHRADAGALAELISCSDSGRGSRTPRAADEADPMGNVRSPLQLAVCWVRRRGFRRGHGSGAVVPVPVRRVDAVLPVKVLVQ